MTRDTNGVALLGRVLARVAEAPCTASGLAEEFGAARTTVFEILRTLEAAGFVERDAQGIISPGEASAVLGFARFGLGSIAGAAAALLPVLRDDTDGRVELVVEDVDGEIVLAYRSPSGWNASAPPGGRANAVLEMPIEGGEGAILRLHLREKTCKLERDAVRRSLVAVADALSCAGRPRAESGRDL